MRLADDAAAVMNVVFLSPSFPATAPAFCVALAKLGITVLGVGDEPLRHGSVEAAALTAHVFEPKMADYAVLHGAVRKLVERHGAIHRIESNGEHWLETEARLRDDFGVPGLTPAALDRQRSKLGMAQIFASAGIACPPGISAGEPTQVRAFAARHGLPLVFKPDYGSGAADTFRVTTPSELEGTLRRDLRGHLVQPFVEGDIVTYDGLADRAGRIVFSTSHAYDTGIMQIREQELDGHYYSLRDVPEDLERAGRRAVAAFGVCERFFHVEFFRRPNCELVALEMNLRPPGGFTTDMMSLACDFDVYELWARALSGHTFAGFSYERKYHTAHAGRRSSRQYRLAESELVHELGDVLVDRRTISPHFAATMGDVMYLLRHRDLTELRRAISLVQSR
jgi:biotin carboxylase